MGCTVCPCSGADKEIERFVPVAGSSGKKPNKQSVTGRCVNSNPLSLSLPRIRSRPDTFSFRLKSRFVFEVYSLSLMSFYNFTTDGLLCDLSIYLDSFQVIYV